MTYIAAFNCKDGIVMCADTQETVEDEKQYSEKLYVIENRSYPLAIGGAGIDEPVEAFSQELMERAEKEQPETGEKLKQLIRQSIEHVYAQDMPVSVTPEGYRTAQYVIAAKPKNDGFIIFKVTGKRIFTVKKRVIIGYATAANNQILERLYRDDLSMQQAVMLAVYLVAHSKAVNLGVGFDTQVAVVTDNGAWIDDPEYIKNSETRVQEFLKLTDGLFLDSIDLSMRPTMYAEKLRQFGENVTQLRDNYSRFSADHSLNRAFHDPTYKGEPYPKIFPGAITTVYGNATVAVREETPEDIEHRRQLMEMANERTEENREAGERFQHLLEGRSQPLFIGKHNVWLGRRPPKS